jgi:hypothetical protein
VIGGYAIDSKGFVDAHLRDTTMMRVGWWWTGSV